MNYWIAYNQDRFEEKWNYAFREATIGKNETVYLS